MNLTTRNVAKGEKGLAKLLDDLHALCVANYRPGWACADPPYPARKDLDRIVADDRSTLVVAFDGAALIGWNWHDPLGHIMGGGHRHGPRDGEADTFDAQAIEVQRTLHRQVRANTGGTCFHLAFANPRVWHGLQVQCGVPPTPLPQWRQLAAQDPPLPPFAPAPVVMPAPEA